MISIESFHIPPAYKPTKRSLPWWVWYVKYILAQIWGGRDGAGSGLRYSARLVTAPDLPKPSPKRRRFWCDVTGRER